MFLLLVSKPAQFSLEGNLQLDAVLLNFRALKPNVSALDSKKNWVPSLLVHSAVCSTVEYGIHVPSFIYQSSMGKRDFRCSKNYDSNFYRPCDISTSKKTPLLNTWRLSSIVWWLMVATLKTQGLAESLRCTPETTVT